MTLALCKECGKEINDLSEKEKAILTFTRTGIFERRRTEYFLLLFFLGVVGTCVTVVLKDDGASSDPNTALVLVFPIVMSLPINTLFWHQAKKIQALDTAQRAIISELPVWHAPAGIISFGSTLLLPIVLLPVLAGCLLTDIRTSLWDCTEFKALVIISALIFVIEFIISTQGVLAIRKKLN